MQIIKEQEEIYRSNILTSSFVEVINLIVRLFISILVARLLGPQGRGEYAISLLIPGFFTTFASFGLGEASASLIGKKKYPTHHIIGCLIFVLTLETIILSFIYLGLQPIILHILKKNITAPLYKLGFLMIPITLFWGGLSSILLSIGIVKPVGYGRLLNNTLFLIFIFSLSMIKTITPITALLIYIFTNTIELLYQYLLIRKRIIISIYISKSIIIDQFLFGWKLFWNNVFWQMNKRLDSYIVAYLMGNYYLGIYTIAVGLVDFLLTIPTVFARVAFSHSLRSNNKESLSIATSSVRQIFYFLIISSAILALLLKPIITILYSTEFIEARIPALLLLPGIISLGVVIVICYIFIGQGYPEKQTYATGIASIFTVVLDIILIPVLGLTGAALAATIAQTISAVYLVISYKKLFKFNLNELFILKKNDIIGFSHDIGIYFNKLLVFKNNIR